MANTLRIGIAGLGNVGVGVLDIIRKHGALLADRAGVAIAVTAVSARDKAKDRGHDLSGLKWFDDPVGLAKSPDIDVFVELMGGEGDPAKSAVEAAIAAGKHVITANKALLALHGEEIFAADTPEEVIAWATATHPEDAGWFVHYIPREKFVWIYAD